jgi:rhodanese-related sulfurtransferase
MCEQSVNITKVIKFPATDPLHIPSSEYIRQDFVKELRAMTVLSLKEAVAKAAKGEITLLDVREADELRASGTAKGAVHIPLALVGLQGKEKLPAGKPVAVFCAKGGRAGQATQTLIRQGFEAHNIGGFADWQAAGGAVTR